MAAAGDRETGMGVGGAHVNRPPLVVLSGTLSMSCTIDRPALVPSDASGSWRMVLPLLPPLPSGLENVPLACHALRMTIGHALDFLLITAARMSDCGEGEGGVGGGELVRWSLCCPLWAQWFVGGGGDASISRVPSWPMRAHNGNSGGAGLQDQGHPG